MKNAIKWILRILIGLITLILLLIIILIIFLGPIAEYVIEKKDMEYVGRRVEMDDLRIRAFNGKIFVDGFTIYEADSSTAFVAFEKLALYSHIRPLLKNRILVDSFTLDGLYANIYQDSGSFNFDDLVDRFAASTDTVKTVETKTEKASPPWTFDIGPLRIDNCVVSYFNTALDQGADLNKFFFYSQGISTDTGLVKMSTGFDFRQNSGIVRVEGDFDYKTFVYKLKFDLDRFSIDWMKRHLQEYANISSFGGFLTTDATIGGDFMGAFDYHGSGVFEFEDFKIVDANKDSVVAIKNVYLELDTFTSENLYYNFSELRIFQPYIRYALYEDGDNIAELLKASNVQADTIVSGGEQVIAPGQDYFNVFIALGEYASYLARTYSESAYTADSILLTDGTIVFEDYTLRSDDVLFLFQDMEVTTSKFDSKLEKVTFDLSTVINQSAYFNAEWDVNPQDVLEMDLIYKLQGLTISSLSPYSFNYTAHPFLSGNLLYEGEVHIHDRMLESKNHLSIESIDVARKQYNDPPVKLPMRLAVAILRDTKGNIDLDVPVSGSIDDPEFKYWPIIWQVLKNLMLKAVAAPFKLLAGLFEVDEESLKEVPYAYGKGYLSKDGEKRIKDIAKVLDGKKEFALQYYPKTNAELEKDFIAVEYIKQMYFYEMTKGTSEKIDTAKFMQITPKDSVFYQYILSNSRVEDALASASDHCKSIIGREALDEAYRKVITAREQSFREALIEGYQVDPNRILPFRPKDEIVQDTINLFRPTILLNFDLMNGQDSLSN